MFEVGFLPNLQNNVNLENEEIKTRNIKLKL